MQDFLFLCDCEQEFFNLGGVPKPKQLVWDFSIDVSPARPAYPKHSKPYTERRVLCWTPWPSKLNSPR